MQTLTMTPSTPLPVLTSPPCAGVSLVIFSAVEEVFTAPDASSALRWLTSRNVPLVLVSQRPAADVLALQQHYGMHRPFVCDGGASLYLPAGYFPELTRIGATRDGWNVVEFKSPDAGHAIRLLVSLFRLCSEEAVVVGLGERGDDRVLLREVDVPVVVRSGAPGQDELVQSLPSAYLTSARGAAGWSEAILGSLAE
jgi:predicted mannosyl-3-phosphoglycerate phosphatase (HAD superfamily)